MGTAGYRGRLEAWSRLELGSGAAMGMAEKVAMGTGVYDCGSSFGRLRCELDTTTIRGLVEAGVEPLTLDALQRLIGAHGAPQPTIHWGRRMSKQKPAEAGSIVDAEWVSRRREKLVRQDRWRAA